MVTGENKQVVPLEDMCVADEHKILCIIRDMVDSQCSGIKHTLNLPGSMTVKQLIHEASKAFGYVDGTVSIHYEKQEGESLHEMHLEQFQDKLLSDVCTFGQKRHNFTVSELEGYLPQKVEVEETASASSGSQASGSSNYFSSSSSTADDFKPSYSVSSSYSTDYTFASALMKSDTGYVGLVNQAMTCYLNSLLQTLYMTPEFRNALYRWEFDGSDEEGVKSIPYHLQRLYLQLQISKKRAVETTDLTRSFGWDSSEVWQQHDVQELCRVMFDALEFKWKNTDQANLINHLYQGKMKDYVKCLECGNESARVDAFLDIPLVIRPFGSSEAYGSVDEAMKAFVSPEILEDTNQYFCEKCNKKCDAHKGLKFVSFPYLLTLQLKRFDFDYATMHRIKLNDRMTFPEILNLKHLVEGEEEEEECVHAGQKCSEEPPPKEVAAENGPISDVDEGIEVDNSVSGASSHDDTSSLSSSEAMVNDKNSRESNLTGPYVYELFSIMIHSGSAAGGHYYAYIKCLTDGQWYSFNDQHVSKITYDDIRKTYGGTGGTRGYYSAAYTSSTNAYMLMYRQIDKERNAHFITVEDFPEHIKAELRKLNDREEKERLQRELDKSTCKIKLFCYHPTQRRRLDHKFEIHKDKTLSEATEMAYKLFDLENAVPLDCCRIVKYDEYQDSLERSFENEDDTEMFKLLGGVKQSYSFDLLLETKRPEQKFQEYRPGGVTVRVYVADIEKEVIHEPVSVRAYHVQTVKEFKSLVSQVLQIPDTHMRCVLERFHNDLRLLTVPNKTLKAEGFFKSNKVYVECSGNEEDTSVPFHDSRLYRLLDREQNTIRIHVNLPSIGDVEQFQKVCCQQTQCPTAQDSAVESGMNSAENSVENGNDVCNDGRDSTEVDEGISDRSDRSGDSDLEHRVNNMTLRRGLSRSDPSLYQSCRRTGDSDSLVGSIGRTGSPVGQSTSSQSTSTSAEFSLSTNLNSHCDANLESSDDFHLSERSSRDPVEHTCSLSDSEQTSPLSPSDTKDLEFHKASNSTSIPCTENWDSDTEPVISYKDTEEDLRRYFCAEEVESTDTGQRSVTVFVDKRITLGAFKKELEPYVRVSSENFKVFRVYSNNQEFESIRLSETLSFLEDGRINVKLGRALKNGEYRVKVYQLLVNDSEPSRFLIDTIFAKGMSVLESKKMILPEVKLQHGLDIPLDRCRLRKKTWKNPGTIYIDSQVYEDEIPIYPNWEVFLEIQDGPDKMESASQLAIYCRRWRPSKYELGPFEEVVVQQQTVEELKTKLSELSEIPTENIEIAKGRGTFPYEVSLLEIQTDLDWNPPVSTLGMWPLYICDDGCLVYYRDSSEQLAELSEEKKKEIQQRENSRLSRLNQKTSYSPRKERALKIYTDEPPASNRSTALDLD